MRTTFYILTTLAFAFYTLLSCIQKDKEETFWEWFETNQVRIYNFENDQDNIFAEVSRELEKVDPNLVFEFSPIHENGIREFTVSADGLKEYFPAVEKLVGKAPKLRNWKINAFRQRIPGDDMAITYDRKLKISYDDIFFTYAKDGNKIGIELHIRNYNKSPELGSAVFILMDGLLGEYDMETKIGWIDMKKLNEKEIDSLFRLVELRDLADNVTISE